MKIRPFGLALITLFVLGTMPVQAAKTEKTVDAATLVEKAVGDFAKNPARAAKQMAQARTLASSVDEETALRVGKSLQGLFSGCTAEGSAEEAKARLAVLADARAISDMDAIKTQNPDLKTLLESKCGKADDVSFVETPTTNPMGSAPAFQPPPLAPSVEENGSGS